MKPLPRRCPAPVRAAIHALAALLVTGPAARAQQGASTVGTWRIEPMVGVWHQGAEDAGAAMRHLREAGPVLGLAVSQQRGAVVRLSASVGYHRIDDASEMTLYGPTGQPRTYTYDREIISLTAGTSGDLWQRGAAAVGIGVEIGAGWTRSRLDRTDGPSIAPFLEPSGGNDWTLAGLIVPSLMARRAIAPRLELSTTVRLLLGVGDFQPQPVPAITVGTTYRL